MSWAFGSSSVAWGYGMTGDKGLSSELAKALGGIGGSDEDEDDAMVERCVNAAEMGVKTAYLTPKDPLPFAERASERKGAKLVEHRSPKGLLRGTSVTFPSGGAVMFTRSRMRAKTFGAVEILTKDG